MLFIDGSIAIIIFLLGLSVGSFLNALIYRLEIDQSVFKGRSFCPHCKTKLKWHDLIPLVSFVACQGKCRYCKITISWQYPIVELAMGLLFYYLAVYFLADYSSLSFLRWAYVCVISSLLVAIFVYDFKHLEIPDVLVILGGAISLLISFFEKFSLAGGILPALLGALVCGGFFFILVTVSKERWMGWGDVKLGVFLGLFLGWENVLAAMFLAFFIGAFFGIILIVLGQKRMKSQLAFGPFLVAGTFIAIFYGQFLINWYFNILYL
jgi:prepilin signal peptidase PulO-like enzyme (type II secretory pathway)